MSLSQTSQAPGFSCYRPRPPTRTTGQRRFVFIRLRQGFTSTSFNETRKERTHENAKALVDLFRIDENSFQKRGCEFFRRVIGATSTRGGGPSGWGCMASARQTEMQRQLTGPCLRVRVSYVSSRVRCHSCKCWSSSIVDYKLGFTLISRIREEVICRESWMKEVCARGRHCVPPHHRSRSILPSTRFFSQS